MNVVNPLEAKVIFINGIDHTERKAEKEVEKLEGQSNMKVTLCWNSCRLGGVFCDDDAPVSGANKCQDRLIGEMKRCMDRKRYVYIIAHSKGVHIVHVVLKKLQKLAQYKGWLKAHVSVGGYGGICILLPDSVFSAKNWGATGIDWLGYEFNDEYKNIAGELQKNHDPSMVLATEELPNGTHYQHINTNYRTYAEVHKFVNAYLLQAGEDLRGFKAQISRKERSGRIYAIGVRTCFAFFVTFFFLSLMKTWDQTS